MGKALSSCSLIENPNPPSDAPSGAFLFFGFLAFSSRIFEFGSGILWGRVLNKCRPGRCRWAAMQIGVVAY